ncbi:MAG: helix-turn-helix domain-containing protein [Kiritimatiellae bacterium]|nr:helix-turn-helix domain-containing protein [Kiritimatiellia bacterium]
MSVTEAKRIQALTRGMDVLELLAESDDGMRLQDIAKELGGKPPAVHHLLSTLVAGGYVERAERPVRYRLGSGLLDLVGRQVRRRLVRRAGEIMLGLQAELGAVSISFCEARGDGLVVSQQMSVRRPGHVQRDVASPLPPYTSLASIVHLAFWPEERAQRYREQHPFDVYGSGLWHSAAAFEAVVDKTRAEGYVRLPLEAGAKVRLIGLPVFSATDEFVASLTIQRIARTAKEAERAWPRMLEAGRAAAGQIGA